MGARPADKNRPSRGKNRTCPTPRSTPPPARPRRRYPAHTPAEVEAILQRAADTFAEYRTTSYAERARHLINAADLFEGEAPDIARIVTTEMGKTFASARGEASKCALGLRWFAEHAESLLADEPIATGASRSYVHYQPIGVGAGHHAVELPAVAGGALCRAGAHGGQRRAAQARLQRAADGAPPRGHLPSGRAARGRLQPTSSSRARTSPPSSRTRGSPR